MPIAAPKDVQQISIQAIVSPVLFGQTKFLADIAARAKQAVAEKIRLRLNCNRRDIRAL